MLEKSLKIAKKERRRIFALILIDIDGFKPVNDRLGHQLGDRVLKDIAEIIRPKREDDDYFAARHGGDEFSLITSREDPNLIFKLTEKIRNDIAALNILDQDENKSNLNVSASIGITFLTKDSKLETIEKEADRAMYCAKGNPPHDSLNNFKLPKNKKGNRIVYYDTDKQQYFLIEEDNSNSSFTKNFPRASMEFYMPSVASTLKEDFPINDEVKLPYIYN